MTNDEFLKKKGVFSKAKHTLPGSDKSVAQKSEPLKKKLSQNGYKITKNATVRNPNKTW